MDALVMARNELAKWAKKNSQKNTIPTNLKSSAQD
jgi:hypothetical protein